MHDPRPHVTHAHLIHVHVMHLHRTRAVHPHPRPVHAMHAAAPAAAGADHVARTPAGTIAEARAVAVAAIAITMSAVAVPVAAIAITAVPVPAMPADAAITVVRRIGAFLVGGPLLGCADHRRVERRTLID